MGKVALSKVLNRRNREVTSPTPSLSGLGWWCAEEAELASPCVSTTEGQPTSQESADIHMLGSQPHLMLLQAYSRRLVTCQPTLWGHTLLP